MRACVKLMTAHKSTHGQLPKLHRSRHRCAHSALKYIVGSTSLTGTSKHLFESQIKEWMWHNHNGNFGNLINLIKHFSYHCKHLLRTLCHSVHRNGLNVCWQSGYFTLSYSPSFGIKSLGEPSQTKMLTSSCELKQPQRRKQVKSHTYLMLRQMNQQSKFMILKKTVQDSDSSQGFQ